MPKRIVDDLETVEVKKENGELHFRFVGAGVGTGASAYLIKRQRETIAGWEGRSTDLPRQGGQHGLLPRAAW